MSASEDEKDRQMLIVICVVVIFFGGGAWAWHTVVDLLVAHRVLVTGPGVLLAIPGTAGAGLDRLRALLAASIGLALLAVAVRVVQRRRAARAETA